MAKDNSSMVGGGIGIGSVIAVIISWTINHSIGWAIWHGVLGWTYVIYRVFFVGLG
jgi:hypothetical protein